MNLNELNTDLARALGVHEPGKASRVTLTIEPGALPQVEVRRWVKNADGLQTAVEMLQLRPQDGGPPKLEEAAQAVVLLGDAQRLRMEPGDVLVVKTPARVSMEQAERIKAAWGALGSPVVVLDAGADIDVLRPAVAGVDGRDPAFAEFGPLVA
jgi:hypothetical protein